MGGLLCLLLLGLVGATSGICYSNCELYDLLNRDYRFFGNSAAQWVCLARELTNACTNYFSWSDESNAYFGLFKIRSEWCSWGNRNRCRTTCNKLKSDDISANIACLKHIIAYRRTRDWDIMRTRCRMENAITYIKGCKQPNVIIYTKSE